MNRQLLGQFKRIKSWNSNGERAPHKPLMILFAVSQLEQGITRFDFESSLESLNQLFESFGPPRRPTPEYPFVRLANDSEGKLWSISGNSVIETSRTYSQKQLIRLNATCGFSNEVLEEFDDPNFKYDLIHYLLEANFPRTVQDDLVEFLGLEEQIKTQVQGKIRDPHFRSRVLEAYEHSCAICGYQVRRGNTLVGVEAAHIKWHQAGGPDKVENGVAMCAMHHKMFDYGLLGIDTNLNVIVSTMANGGFGLKEWLLKFQGIKIRTPARKVYYPEIEFTQWQMREVFKGYIRDACTNC